MRSVSAPAIPPVRLDEISEEVALVDDRPGHYRRMVTASGRQQKMRTRQKARTAFLVALSMGVLIAGLMATYLVRKNKKQVVQPVVEEVYQSDKVRQIEGQLKIQGVDPVPKPD